MRKLVIVLSICVLSAATLIAQYGTETKQTTAKGTDPAISKISSAYQEAANAENISKVISLYTEDAIEMPPNEPMLKGRANIEAYYKKMFAETDGNLKITPMESSISGSFAYETGTYRNTVKTTSGQTMNEIGKYVVVLKRGGDNQWRVSHAIYNSDQPPPPIPPQKKS